LDRSAFDTNRAGEPVQLRCSVCKSPVTLEAGPGLRRAALIEDGLTLCDVCAPAGNMQRLDHSH